MPATLITVILLCGSSLLMTVAWYAHLKRAPHRHWTYAALTSWAIAFFEYLILVPALRLGYTQFSIAQLKIIQETIGLAIFIPFSIGYLKEPFRRDYIWAALCLIGAVYFIFRG